MHENEPTNGPSTWEARSLVTRRTNTIALIVSESEERFFGDPFFAGIVRGISAEVSAQSRQLVLTMAHSEQDRDRVSSYLAARHADGVLLLALHGDDSLPRLLEDSGVITVVGGRPYGWDAGSWVDVDNVKGAKDAVLHLVQRGRRAIATLAGPQDMIAGLQRLAGYREGLREANLVPDVEVAETGDFSETSGAQAMRQVLETAPNLDAVFAASDSMAVGAMRVLQESGRRIPDDVAIVGFDDSPLCQLVHPALTSVHQPIDEMGRQMARALMARIEHPESHPKVLLDTRLVIRDST